jgi:nucleotide-binding universal stress UspA family protein
MTYATVIAGVDGTRAGFEAARQAAALVDEGGRLLLVAIEDGWDVLAGRWGGVTFAWFENGTAWTLERRKAELHRRAQASLERAAQQLDAPATIETRAIGGRAWEELRTLVAQERADLLAVGTHGGSRTRGIVLGHTATSLAHEAACSLLIARPPFDPASFPGSLAVGYDGSPQSEQALDAAIGIAARHAQLPVRIVTCRPVPPGLAREAAIARSPAHFVFDDEHLLADDGLVEASQGVDLLLLGSRGLHGVAALGSISERVAHRAAGSVLIVR